ARGGGGRGWGTAGGAGGGRGGGRACSGRAPRGGRGGGTGARRDPAAAGTLPVGVVQARVLDHVAVVAQPGAINPARDAQHGLAQQVTRELLGREHLTGAAQQRPLARSVPRPHARGLPLVMQPRGDREWAGDVTRV